MPIIMTRHVLCFTVNLNKGLDFTTSKIIVFDDNDDDDLQLV